jgi:transcriptional regulator with XRE-family HTH domain
VAGKTFGQVVSGARRAAGMSQKELAARIRKEDGAPISPQYLNDLERDRRNPPAEAMLRQFAAQLGLDPEYLCFVAGQLPDDLRRVDGAAAGPERVVAAFQAFRRTLRGADEGGPGATSPKRDP